MAEEKERYKQIHDLVKRLENDWFFFTYEDMINKTFKGLNYYLGFNVAGDVEVPKTTGKSKVIRKKIHRELASLVYRSRY